ncbi:MAG: DUF305 domain-containing protein [Pyrinomonadaceae bacterium]|nr:DUF305 domain-containing protein [Pyrinomonadaceae bacterium]
MKNAIFILTMFLTIAATIFTIACEQNATNATRTNQSAATNSNAASMATMNHNGMNHNAMNHNGMNHNGMSGMNMDSMNHDSMKSSPDAANAPFDLQFLDTMIPHHQSAVDMAKMVLTQSQNPELKKFAENIIADQNREVSQMKGWREQWFVGNPVAMNMEMPGMADSMKTMMGDEMKKLETATGKTFDLLFLEMMIPHHNGAVVMSKDALNRAEHVEIKTLSTRIIKSQEAEIKQMSDWKTQWAK